MLIIFLIFEEAQIQFDNIHSFDLIEINTYEAPAKSCFSFCSWGSYFLA